MEFYKGQGTVSLFQWNLPLKSQKDIRTEAMFTAMNDCTLRSVGRFDLLAIVDVDEFILPVKASNLSEMMAKKLSIYPQVGSYVFPNVFHYLYWENTTSDVQQYWSSKNNQELPYLVTQMKLQRVKTPHKNGQRSKYLIRPENALMVGNHVVWQLSKGTYVIINT